MSEYRRDSDETKYMSFLIKNYELPEKYNEIQDKVSKVIKEGFDSESVYNEKYLKTEIKSYDGKINTHFCDNKVPEEGSQYICLPIVLVDSVYRKLKDIIHSCFLKNVHNFSKIKKWLNKLLKIQEFLLIKKILMRKIWMFHTNLMKNNFLLTLRARIVFRIF